MAHVYLTPPEFGYRQNEDGKVKTLKSIKRIERVERKLQAILDYEIGLLVWIGGSVGSWMLIYLMLRLVYLKMMR